MARILLADDGIEFDGQSLERGPLGLWLGLIVGLTVGATLLGARFLLKSGRLATR